MAKNILSVLKQTRKALEECRPPPSILIRHNIVVPFKAMLIQNPGFLPDHPQN